MYTEVEYQYPREVKEIPADTTIYNINWLNDKMVISTSIGIGDGLNLKLEAERVHNQEL